jgi:hypothetical protein
VGEQATARTTADPCKRMAMTRTKEVREATAKAKYRGLSIAVVKCACPFDLAQGRDDVVLEWYML